MKRKRNNTKYNRIYGKGIQQLSKELGYTASAIAYQHKSGMLKHLEINSVKYLGNVDKRISALLENLDSRCNNPKDRKFKYYGGKNIKALLTVNDLVYFWYRDKAHIMKQPSIDRIDSKGDYVFNNCRFIEMEDNRKRK